MGKTLQQLLFKEDDAINGITPLVPALWTRDPLLDGLAGIENAYPSITAIAHRLQAAIECIQASDLAENTKKTRAHGVERMRTKGGPSFALRRDHNGEYAPALASLFTNGTCTVIPGNKPSSMIATLNESLKHHGSTKQYKRTDFRADDNDAVADIVALLDRPENKKVKEWWFSREGEKGQALCTALFDPFALKGWAVQTVGAPKGMVALANLHERWAENGTLAAFRARVEEITPKKNRQFWFRGLMKEGGGAEVKAEKPKSEVALNDGNSVKPSVVTYAFWIRRQDPFEHSHNMGQDLLDEIVTALAHVSAVAYPNSDVLLLLFGDRVAEKMRDLPIHKKGGSAVSAAKTISQFMVDRFHQIHPAVSVKAVDLRDLYSRAAFKTPALDDEKLQAEQVSAIKNKKDAETVDNQLKALQDGNKSGNLTYSQQYASYFAIDAIHHPRFIIGAESGNMDGFGYCGIPVISIDVEDANDMPTTVLADRIGQYSLVTPLWEVINYHRGENSKLVRFRQHLYGAFLKYTRYSGALHETKTGKPSSALPPDMDKDELARLTKDETSEFLKFDAVDSWDQKVEGFKTADVKGDGNCLFRAISVLLFGSEEHHELLREEAVDTAALLFQDDLAVVNEHDDFENMETYVKTMKQPATKDSSSRQWGGFPEIVALAIRYDISIAVHSTGMATVTANDGEDRTLDLLYVNRNHYKALTPE